MDDAVEVAKQRLRDLRPSIDAARTTLDVLYDERRRAFRAALDLGISQREAARCAGVTPMAVALALQPKANSTMNPRSNRENPVPRVEPERRDARRR